MSINDRDWTVPGVRSVCCNAPVLEGDVCTKCHEHCWTSDDKEEG